MCVFHEERNRFETNAPALPVNWQQAGPTNIGGRMTSLATDPTDPDRLIAGAAGGGVWASSNAGRSWAPLWHRQPTLNVGAVTMDPSNPNVIYVGTGEANQSADSHPGVGIFVSRDGGSNWTVFADAEAAHLPSRIGAIVVDPANGNHILLGGVSHSSADFREGLYRTTDGGSTWSRADDITPGRYRCHDIRFGAGQTIFATIEARSRLSGIWRSEDGGTSWTQLQTGLPSGDQLRRGSLAVAPSDQTRIYAQFSSSGGGVQGIYRSNDSGDSWRPIAGGHLDSERQMGYNNTIVVHPTNPDHVLCAGVEVHRTTNGGASWQKRTRWSAEIGDGDYAHADQHALVMPVGAPGRVYAMNDGGMDVSENGGTTWENRSDGLEVCMFYDFTVAQSNADFYGGGFQDQGTNITTSGRADDHFMISGGDGGWFEIDPSNEMHFYTSSQRMRILRFRGDLDPPWSDVSPLPANSQERQRTWMVYIAMDPNNSQRIFTGTSRVFRTIDDAQNWLAVSHPLDDSIITAIEICRADSDRIYIGTTNGGLFRSIDGGDTWSGDLSGPALPGRTVTRIAAHPVDADTVFCTVAGFGHPHVYRSADGGLSWRDAGTGQLPDVPHHSLAISPTEPGRVFVAHDLGVSASLDGGATWQNISGDLPNQMVVDLAIHVSENRLFAATYGRSAWKLDLSTL
ncbi:hypothetical protein EBB79_07300 [Parasedimentitalea marina]|uniref:Sortilin N-terminal domain-containing protein n=1 Tax=Parasedimentitalea marina TaxID=2483033 RepID=A0A3T0N104_9RHOB|nr:hypothetical protein [Parasedimentitalea marina]AZV77714.1 hypothetical protein EBB79_07300 [Parasedimentitalea marina]